MESRWHREEEAPHGGIRAAHRRILAGDKVSVIQQDWARRGVAPSNANGERYKAKKKGEAAQAPMSHSHLQQSPDPSGAGRYERSTRARSCRISKGSLVKGSGAPICTPGELDAVTAILAERKRTTRGGQGVTKYLLSSIARCSECSHGVRGGIKEAATTTPAPSPAAVRQGRPRRAAGHDLVIYGAWRTASASAPLAQARSHPGKVEAKLGEAQAEIAELIQARKDKKISAAVLIELMPELEARAGTSSFRSDAEQPPSACGVRSRRTLSGDARGLPVPPAGPPAGPDPGVLQGGHHPPRRPGRLEVQSRSDRTTLALAA